MSSIGSRLAGGTSNPQFGAGYPQNQQSSAGYGSPYGNNSGVIPANQITPNRGPPNSGVIPPSQVATPPQQQLYRPAQQSYSSPYGQSSPAFGGSTSAQPPPQNHAPQYSPSPHYNTHNPAVGYTPPPQNYPQQNYGAPPGAHYSSPQYGGPTRYGQAGRSFVGQIGQQFGGKIPADFADIAIQKSIEIKDWGLKTYRCTKQVYNERTGKASKTVDFQLEQKIEKVKETKTRYTKLLELATLLHTQLNAVKGTHRAMAEVLLDLCGKQPELDGEFYANGKTYEALNDQSDTLIKTLSTFTDGLKTLVEKTIQDSLDTISTFEKIRVEFDSYRNQLEDMHVNPAKNAMSSKMRDVQINVDKKRRDYEKKRDDVNVKLTLLDENRVKVIRQQLLLLHSATVSYFNGAHDKVAATLVRLEKYQAERENQNNVPSFLENDPNEPKVPRPKTGSRLASYAEPDEKMAPQNERTMTPEVQYDMLGEPIVPNGSNGTQSGGINIIQTNTAKNMVPATNIVPTANSVSNIIPTNNIIHTNNIVKNIEPPLVNIVGTIEMERPESGLSQTGVTQMGGSQVGGTPSGPVIVGTVGEFQEKAPAVEPVDLITTAEDDLHVQFKEAAI